MNTGVSKRVFIGIKMNEEMAGAFVKLQSEIAGPPARFIPPEDMHMTLVPPFEMSDPAYVDECVRVALARAKRFTLKTEHLAYGPVKMRPSLAWIKCAVSEELIALKKELMRAFGKTDQWPFKPHVTIARFAKKDADMLTHRPIERAAAFSMPVEEITLYESPDGGGRGYTVLDAWALPVVDGLPR